MKYFVFCVLFLLSYPLFAQDNSNIYVTSNNKFQFEIPENWELMKEESGRVTIVYVGDEGITKYTVISLGFTDLAPNFEENTDVIKFMLGRNANIEDFEIEQVGQYPTLIDENDQDQIDTLFAIILIADGVVGAVEVNELDFPADLNEFRPIVNSIITSMQYIASESTALDELEAITPDVSSLTNLYEAESDLFQLNYPEDWVVQAIETDLILIGSSNFDPNSIPDLGIQVFVLKNPDWINPSTNFLPEILDLMMENFETSNNMSVRSINLDGRRAAIMRDESNSDSVVMLALQVDDEHFAVLTGIRDNYGYEEAEMMVMAVASTIKILGSKLETIDVDTSELSETAIVLDGLLTFDYPENWVLDTTGLISLYLPRDLESPDPDNQEITLIINVFPKTVEEGITANSSLLDVAETIQQSRRGESSPATEFMLDELPAVLMNMGLSDLEAWVLYLEFDQGIVAQVMILPYEEDFKPYRDVVYAIASTIVIK